MWKYDKQNRSVTSMKAVKCILILLFDSPSYFDYTGCSGTIGHTSRERSFA